MRTNRFLKTDRIQLTPISSRGEKSGAAARGCGKRPANGGLQALELAQDETRVFVVGNGQGTDGTGAAVEDNDAKLIPAVASGYVLGEVNAVFQGLLALLSVKVKIV